MKLKHPTLDAVVEVEADKASKWVRAGWVSLRPPAPKPKPEPVKEPESK